MSVSIQIIACFLLLGRLIAVFFMARVLKRQWGLFKLNTYKELIHFRRVMFALAVVIMLGQLVPIVIDSLSLFVSLGRPTSLRPISVLYAVSNATTAAISAFCIDKLYRLAAGNEA